MSVPVWGSTGGLAAALSTGGAAVLLAVGAVAAFSDAVFPNRFRMGSAPGVRSKRGVVGLAGKQTIENIFDVGPDIQVVADRTADERKEVRGTRRSRSR